VVLGDKMTRERLGAWGQPACVPVLKLGGGDDISAGGCGIVMMTARKDK
jgi:hypothetical protein